MIITDWRPFIYGGIASCFAEFGTFPIDTSKTRLQIQGQTIDCHHAKLRYNGMLDCLIKIGRQEGVKVLYSGLKPALLRQSTYGTIKIGTYYSLKSVLRKNGLNETLALNSVCAIIAGAVSSAIANPTDVLKIRMQAQGSNPNNSSLLYSFKDIYIKEGISGLWKGVQPTSQRAAIIAAVELPVYDFSKNLLLPIFGDHILNHFSSSLIAGVGCAIASTPIDVIRTRLMNQRKFKHNLELSSHLSAQIYTGTIDCFVRTLKTEGFWALYKGVIPAIVRLGPWNVLFFVTYEQLKKSY